MMFRQGDLLITEVEEIPRHATPVPRERGRCVLAKGETTGHEHAVAEPDVEHLRVPGERQFLDVKGEGASLVHDEHGTIDLPAGKYEITTQREYAPTGRRGGGSRYVYD
jgi:hypothetical protein